MRKEGGKEKEKAKSKERKDKDKESYRKGGNYLFRGVSDGSSTLRNHIP
jgi:hypothetical protein